MVELLVDHLAEEPLSILLDSSAGGDVVVMGRMVRAEGDNDDGGDEGGDGDDDSGDGEDGEGGGGIANGSPPFSLRCRTTGDVFEAGRLDRRQKRLWKLAGACVMICVLCVCCVCLCFCVCVGGWLCVCLCVGARSIVPRFGVFVTP